jgi:gliding motility-associated protein GldC
MTQCIFITTQNINQAIMNDRNSKIEISVDLDENKIPEKIFWSAEDGNIKNKESKALFLSVWDSEKKESLRIDLWTKEMPLDEMKIFFHQTLVAMSDTFNRATQDEKMTATMKDFCDYFAEKLNLKQN